MRILHLTNDYSGSTVYKNLFEALDELGIEQVVYNAVISKEKIGKNKIQFRESSSRIIYSKVLNIFTRINFYYKKRKILSDLGEKVQGVLNIDLIHAHTWFSDGAIAYELHKSCGIPYIIAIRSTDIDIFFEYLFYLRNYGIQILKSAKQIIFISESLKQKFLSNELLNRELSLFSGKIQVIPNGIPDFWLKNLHTQKEVNTKAKKLIYVGSFIKRKNVARLIRAVEVANQNGCEFSLTLVGRGSDKRSIRKQIKGKGYIANLGHLKQTELCDVFRQHDIFAMPSYNETFGLVYIEALSQGLPIVYSKGEGIDGLYGLEIGESVDPYSVHDIYRGITKVANNFSLYKINGPQIVLNHNWKTIARKYQDIYLNTK